MYWSRAPECIGHLWLMNAFIEASYEHIWYRENRASISHLTGWNYCVQPLRNKSLFWHHTWVDCSRPRFGYVADIMRSTRAAYHWAVQHIKRNQNDITGEKFANALTENHKCDFWRESKCIRSSHSTSTNLVDGVCELCCLLWYLLQLYELSSGSKCLSLAVPVMMSLISYSYLSVDRWYHTT